MKLGSSGTSSGKTGRRKSRGSATTARRAIACAAGMAAACLLGVALAGGQAAAPQTAPQTAPQAAPAQRQLLAEDVYKNIQVLRGVPENQFLSTMGFFAASLTVDCSYCHNSQETWASYAEDNNDHKAMARKMILMMQAINRTNFGGKKEVTCYTCHRGSTTPKVIPVLADMYGSPPVDDPDEITEAAPNVPTADQIIDKYIQAIGGAQKVAAITSVVAKGVSQGFLEQDKRPTEFYAKAPEQRVVIIHKFDGDMTTLYNAGVGWVAEPGRPLPLLELTGSFLDGAKVDANLSFPGRIKQSLTKWIVGFPITIDDNDVQVVQGKSAAGSPVKLYFDAKSGLLVRELRYTDSPVGTNPVEWDYSDYRDVGGVKFPFKWTQTWTDGRTIYEMSQIQTNVPIDAAKFNKPAPPTPPKPAAK
jgi:photosynthetic reaction center cytochrome c subunit